jgi:hypothetical protein
MLNSKDLVHVIFPVGGPGHFISHGKANKYEIEQNKKKNLNKKILTLLTAIFEC